MLGRSPRRRTGFTLAEVLTAVAIIAILASVTVPAVKARVQDGYEDAIIQEFQTLSQAILAYRQDVGKYPPNVSYLLGITTIGTTPGVSPTDICGNFLTATDSAKWNGPYISRTYNTALTSYTIANRDAVQTTFQRQVSASGSFLAIRIDNLDTPTANDIDLRVDGVAGPTIGTIRITFATPNQTFWEVPIRPSGC